MMMKTIFFLTLLSVLVSGKQSDYRTLPSGALKCYGYSPCAACTTCNYCQHCNSSGACGVCASFNYINSYHFCFCDKDQFLAGIRLKLLENNSIALG
jgi:hypothetical protein